MRRALAACAVWLAAGCLSERPRPAPPVLLIVFDSTAIHSTTPNSDVTGRVHVTDADGLDSVWLEIDTVLVGADGAFLTVYDAPFRDFPVPAGLAPGTQVPVSLAARDLLGFRSELDTFVTVAQ